MYGSDPKRPKNIIFYNVKPAEESSDFIQLISMLFGIASFLLKVKWGIWLSLIFFLSSYVNLKYNSDQKNFFMNFSLIMLGFFMIYFVPGTTYNPAAAPSPPKQ